MNTLAGMLFGDGEGRLEIAIDGLEKALQMVRDKKPYVAIEAQLGLSINTLREVLE